MRVGEKEGKLLVATDLDGSLLDYESYSFDPARPALARLAAEGIPLVLASSKTRAEMVPLSRAIPAACCLIVENGGAVLVPESFLARGPEGAVLREGFWTLVLGAPRREIVSALDAIVAETGARLKPFSNLGADEVAHLTGLSIGAAALALEREYDEPFLLEEGSIEAMTRAAEERGLRLTRGGRFWHLTGRTDKGKGLRTLLHAFFRGEVAPTTVGLGDAANDLSLLQAVDRPIVIPGPSGRPDPGLSAELPLAELAPFPGAEGWNAAVLAVLAGEELPRVGASS